MRHIVVVVKCTSISASYCKQFTHNVQVMTRTSWSRVKTVLRRLSHQSPKICFHQKKERSSKRVIFYLFKTFITFIQSLFLLWSLTLDVLDKNLQCIVFHSPLDYNNGHCWIMNKA